MSEGIEDLDKFVPEDRRVKLFGDEYLIPGDMPMETYLRVTNATTWTKEDQRLDERDELPENRREDQRGRQIVDAIADLFVQRLPENLREQQREQLTDNLMKLGMRTLAGFLSKVYAPPAEDEPVDADAAVVVEDAAPVPPQNGQTGTTSTTPPSEPVAPSAS